MFHRATIRTSFYASVLRFLGAVVRVRWLAVIAVTASGITQFGCDAIGPAAIKQSRPDYNSVIQETSKNQMFLNLVRVREHETTLFMEVTEVDLSLEFLGSVNASMLFPAARVGNSGKAPISSGHDYGLGGSMEYLQSPTIRYQPLQGPALVAQLSHRINVDSMAELFDSEWPVGAVFTLAVSRCTPNEADYYDAVDAIIWLSAHNALIIAPTHADPTNSGPNDSLVLYFTGDRIRDFKTHAVDEDLTRQATRLWDRLWEIYESSQPAGISKSDCRIELRASPKAFLVTSKSTQHTVENIDSPTTRPTHKETRQEISQQVAQPVFAAEPLGRRYQRMPTLRTRSAFGILQALTQPDLDDDPAVFVSADQFEKRLQPMVRRFSKALAQGKARSYYVFDSEEFTGLKDETANADSMPADGPWRKPSPSDPKNDLDVLPDGRGLQDFCEDGGFPERGDRQRHFLIIITQDAADPAPANAYVSAVCHNRRYYIDGEDVVSQRNFALISHFLTIQAAAQSQLLPPTLNVGPR